MSNIEELFWHILTYSFLLPVLSFLILFNRLRSYGTIVVVVVYCTVIFLLLSFDNFLNHYNRQLYSVFYTTVEYSCFAYVIGTSIQNKRIKLLILYLSFGFLLFEILYWFIGTFDTIDSVPIGVETILILLYAFYLLFEQFQKTETAYIYNHPWFWFLIGIMFYLSCSFFFNILATNYYDTAKEFWYLTYIFETIKNILFVIGIITFSKQKKNKKGTSSVPYLDMI
jgi:hypothetical protein